jgi:uncharacterized protein YigA (DUF484 family)
MTESTLSADEVARFLRDNPQFFEAYAELLASITVPQPHGGRAISLHERQLEVLREKVRAHELRLAELLRIGQDNDAITDKLQRWTRQLLLASDAAQLPDIVVDGLRTVFSVPSVAMRLWGLREAYLDLECAQPVPVDVITSTNGMAQPFCGPNAGVRAAEWLPEAGAETRSIALLPLRKGVDPKAFGLIVLGSSDPDRFTTGMGTTFLERIGETASAALSRLAE